MPRGKGVKKEDRFLGEASLLGKETFEVRPKGRQGASHRGISGKPVGTVETGGANVLG